MVAAGLLILATLIYATVPSINKFAHGSETPFLLTGLMRVAFLGGVLILVAVLYPSVLSRKGIRVMVRVFRSDWKLLGLAMLTTWDVALFTLAYRFVDISVPTAMTAMAPAANVVILALLNSNWINRRQALGLIVSAIGVLLVMWAGGSTIETGSDWVRFGIGVAFGIGMIVCGGLVVSALRLGEVLAIEWYWEELGSNAGMVWCGSMLTLALAQGITAPLFIVAGAPSGLPQWDRLLLMLLLGITVLLGTSLWTLANGSGLRPAVNALGYLQPGFALIILAILGLAGGVNWLLLTLGLTVIIAANITMQLWGGEDW